VHVSEYLHEKQIGSVVAMDFKKKQKVLGGNGTRCSQAVTHPSTDRARRCLTSVIGRQFYMCDEEFIPISSDLCINYLIGEKSETPQLDPLT
jgi:hypothetical protein